MLQLIHYNKQPLNKAQFRIPDVQHTLSVQIPANGYGHPVLQNTCLVNQSSYMNHLQSGTTQAEQSFTNRTDPSVI